MIRGDSKPNPSGDAMISPPRSGFEWNRYLGRLLEGLQAFGLRSEALDKSHMDQQVKKAVLRDYAIANQLNLSFHRGHAGRKLNIKLEIDVNPPNGSGYDYTYLAFPLDFEVCHQDLASNFALNIHVLPCRTSAGYTSRLGPHPPPGRRTAASAARARPPQAN